MGDFGGCREELWMKFKVVHEKTIFPRMSPIRSGFLIVNAVMESSFGSKSVKIIAWTVPALDSGRANVANSGCRCWWLVFFDFLGFRNNFSSSCGYKIFECVFFGHCSS